VIPLWSFVEWLLKDKLRKFTMTINRTKKLHPSVAEIYQLFMLAIFAVALWQIPNSACHPWWWIVFLFFIVAFYRAWEILIIGLKWLLVDKAPLHSYQRSLFCFVINLIEISTIYTIAGYPINKAVNGQQFWQVLRNIGKAFKLEQPPLDGLYATLFSVESTFIIIFVLTCVIGGIQRRT
jgi:hypothetical protein